jgi:hypothetical protein
MGHVGSEALAQLVLLLDAVGHLVERPAHLAELVVAVRLKALAPVAGGEAAGRGGELGD